MPRCCSVAGCLPSLCEALGSMPGTREEGGEIKRLRLLATRHSGGQSSEMKLPPLRPIGRAMLRLPLFYLLLTIQPGGHQPQVTPPISTDTIPTIFGRNKKDYHLVILAAFLLLGSPRGLRSGDSQPSAGLVTPLTIPPHADDRMTVFAMGLQCPTCQPLCDEYRFTENGGLS